MDSILRRGHGLVVLLAPVQLEASLAALHPEERAVAMSFAPIRQREWVSGRTALRKALRHLGLDSGTPLLRNERGAPLLPSGALGSISHKGPWAAAFAAPLQADCTLGVDIERADATRIDISSRVLTTTELAQISTLNDQERALAVTLRFSLKEAIYKAIDPWVRRYVGFREIELAVGQSVATAQAVEPRLREELADVTLRIEWSKVEEHWLSTVLARKG